MSIKVMSQVWDASEQKGSGLLLLLSLADYANDDGFCWPSIETLAKKTRLSESSVMRLTGRVATAGELKVYHRKAKGNRYVVLTGCNTSERKARIKKASAKVEPSKLEGKPSKLKGETAKLEGETSTAMVDDPSIEPPNEPLKESSTIAPNGATPPKPLTDWQLQVKDMAEAICTVTGDDIALANTKKRAGQIAAQFLKAGYTPAEVTDDFVQYWYREDWRGKQHQRPTLEQMKSEIGKIHAAPVTVPRASVEDTGPAQVQRAAKTPLTPDEQVWEKVKEALNLQLPPETFDTWVKPSHLADRSDNQFRVAVHSVHAKQWLDNRLRKVVERTVQRVTQDDTATVEFVAAEAVTA